MLSLLYASFHVYVTNYIDNSMPMMPECGMVPARAKYITTICLHAQWGISSCVTSVPKAYQHACMYMYTRLPYVACERRADTEAASGVDIARDLKAPWRCACASSRDLCVCANVDINTCVYTCHTPVYIQTACIWCYMHACIHTYIHACIHTYIHTYINTYIWHAYDVQRPL